MAIVRTTTRKRVRIPVRRSVPASSTSSSTRREIVRSSAAFRQEWDRPWSSSSSSRPQTDPEEDTRSLTLVPTEDIAAAAVVALLVPPGVSVPQMAPIVAIRAPVPFEIPILVPVSVQASAPAPPVYERWTLPTATATSAVRLVDPRTVPYADYASLRHAHDILVGQVVELRRIVDQFIAPASTSRFTRQ